jgi:NAD(P)-dependent dehydrogenase (short-subunit alcohol dehydrogenase family)
VLVTGGNRGIGLSIARRLASGGDSVTVTSRSAEPVEGLSVVRCDVRDAASVDAAFGSIEAEQGPVEVLVANAGVTRDQLLALMSEDDFGAVLDTNLTGAYRVAKRAVRPMMKMRRGRLIFISSVVGLYGSAGQANYAASKAGLVDHGRGPARPVRLRGRGGRHGGVPGRTRRGLHHRRGNPGRRRARDGTLSFIPPPGRPGSESAGIGICLVPTSRRPQASCRGPC